MPRILSGAQQVPVQRRLQSLSKNKGPPCLSFSLTLRAPLVGSHDPSQAAGAITAIDPIALDAASLPHATNSPPTDQPQTTGNTADEPAVVVSLSSEATAARPARILSRAALRFMARTPFRRANRL